MPYTGLTMTPAALVHSPAPSISNATGTGNASSASIQGQGHEEHLVSALHAALHSLGSAPSPGTGEHATAPLISSGIATSPMPVHSPLRNEKPHAPTLDISVASDQLHLRGTGVDVEPTLLSGNIVLHLFEPTSIKQIVLVFRGKARVPSNPHDPHVLNSSPNQYIVCNHEWTFLEGEKKHSHTLKAGRHLFPFELRLGGALPSSLATYVNGGASISYKLRATAIRPGLAANLTASLPITLLRTFASESLEYQQTLEIENTWPEKVMYSLMIPHKAWAAGDDLTALMKFAPLTKGVRVISVTTHVCETTKTLARGGHLEKTRNIVTRKHEIVNGQAVSVEDQQRKRLHNALQKTLGEQGGQSTGLSGLSSHSGTSSPAYGYAVGGASGFVSGTSTPVTEGLALARSRTHDSSGSGGSAPTPGSGTRWGSSGSPTNVPPQEETDAGDSAEITTSITIPLPPSLTPSHSLDPIIVTYRIRWSVLLGNLDGHTSELRCSLPVHILDYSLLDEARAATLATRRLLFGGDDAAREAAEEEVQLPSYPSHVRDRLAMDVTSTPFEAPAHSSGTTTPAHEGGTRPLVSANFPGFTQDNNVAVFAFGAPLSRAQTQNVSVHWNTTGDGGTPPESSSAESSRSNTRPSSRHERDASAGVGGWGPFGRARMHSRGNSRANSRAPSPERGERDHSQTYSHAASIQPTTPGVSRADETHIHVSNAASRQPHGLFSVTMKPLTSLGLGGLAPWHTNSHTASLAAHFRDTHALAHRTGSGSVSSFGSPASTNARRANGMVSSASTGDLRTLVTGNATSGSLITPGTPNDGPTAVLNMDINTSTVPDYFTAAQASSSVVPPLESLRGLPTYEDSEAQACSLRRSMTVLPSAGASTDASEPGSEPQRSFSDTDLVSLSIRSQRVR